MIETAVEPKLGSESEQRVRAEQVAVLCRFPARLLGNIVNSGLVVGVTWGEVPVALLLPWFGLFVLVVAGRFWTSRAFQRRQRDPGELEVWTRWFFLGALTMGAVWGAGSVIIWLTPKIEYHVFFAFVIAGTSAASTVMSMPHLPSARAFLILSVAPLALSLLAVGGGMHVAMGVMCLLYIALLMGQARVSNAVFMDSLRLREKNRVLVADLTAARDSLEDRVRERTEDLVLANTALESEVEAHRETGERLRQAQKLEAVGRLTGGIAHDFNNLLAIVLGNAELLLRRDGDKENEKQLQTILRAGKRGAELTGRLLAFSRKQTLNPETVDVGELVGSLKVLLTRSLGEAVDVRIATRDGSMTACVDPGQLENAILNLALNARDAMNGAGTLAIEVAGARMEASSDATGLKSGDYVVVTVNDTGKGIAAEDMDKIYEPFFTTKEVGEGSGLGLSMVYGFIKQSGGHIDIDSRPGEGATVRLYLPSDDRMVPLKEEATANGPIPSGSGRIMVVEDDDEVRSVVTGFLDNVGYDVLQCDSADAALGMLEVGELPDLVLTDVVLPKGFNGPAMVAEIRRKYGPIRVLFMTGHSADGFEGQGGNPDEGDVVLNKPFELGELAHNIERALDGELKPLAG